MVEGRVIDVEVDSGPGDDAAARKRFLPKLLFLIQAPAQRLVTAMAAWAATWRWWWIRA